MKLTSLLILASLATLIASASHGAPGAMPEKKKTPDAPVPVAAAAQDKSATAQDARRDHYPLRGELVSVSPTLLVLKGAKSKPSRKFDITSDTKIVLNDRPASIKDAKEGQQVTGYVHKSDKGNPQIVSLNLSPKQKDKADDAKSDDKKTVASADKKKKAA
jgi:hypothetical protein